MQLYILNYVQDPITGQFKAWKQYDEVVYRLIDIGESLGLPPSPTLEAVNPYGEVEISPTAIVASSISNGLPPTNVTRIILLGNFSFAPDGRANGSVDSMLVARGDGSYTGKLFAAPLSLDQVLRSSYSALLASTPGTSLTSPAPLPPQFAPYLPLGWQADPLGSDAIGSTPPPPPPGFTPLGSSLVGTDADDSLLVAAGDPTISLTTAILARDGNDSLAIDAPLNATLINLNKGDDSLALSATATASSIFGGGGNDILSLAALLSSEIRGGGGNDRITLTGSISGASLINGNLGDDLISASLVTNAVALSAGAGNDTLLGSAYADTLTAGAGSDSVLAADGDDLLLLGTLDPGEVINGGNGTNTLRWSSDAGIDFSIASLSAIQQLELAPGGSGDTYTIAQGLSSGSPLLITGGGIATGEADQLRIRQAASSGAFSLAQSAGGDLLTYTDAITGSPVTITFANSFGGSVRTEGGDLVYTSLGLVTGTWAKISDDSIEPDGVIVINQTGKSFYFESNGLNSGFIYSDSNSNNLFDEEEPVAGFYQVSGETGDSGTLSFNPASNTGDIFEGMIDIGSLTLYPSAYT